VAKEVLVGAMVGSEVYVGVAVSGTGVCVAAGGTGVAVRRSGVGAAAGVAVGGIGIAVGVTAICVAGGGTGVAVGASGPQAATRSSMTSTNSSRRPDVDMALFPSWVTRLALATSRRSQLVPGDAPRNHCYGRIWSAIHCLRDSSAGIALIAPRSSPSPSWRQVTRSSRRDGRLSVVSSAYRWRG
jgi:hypothetical protein